MSAVRWTRLIALCGPAIHTRLYSVLMKNAASQLAFVLKCTGWPLSPWLPSSQFLACELPAISAVSTSRKFVWNVRCNVQFRQLKSRGTRHFLRFLSSCVNVGYHPGKKVARRCRNEAQVADTRCKLRNDIIALALKNVFLPRPCSATAQECVLNVFL